MTNKEKDVTVPFLEGEIINLCPLKMEHATLYTKWSNDPEVRRYSRNTLPWSIDEIKKWSELEEQRVKKEVVFEVWHRKDEKSIGIAGLGDINWLNRNANLFVTIGEQEYWSQNIGPEVGKLLINYGFEELNLHKIFAGIFTPNKRSLRTAEKIGLKYEARLKEQIYVDGEFVDEMKFAIFKKDWVNSKR
ncbi:MAG: GNAT family N-acetyltransferase [Promethearchaeota archaeon]|nr:MAG: GNAT family N-acetyltransferase [Candidatus Lokiarchaeota archaeon]